MFEEEKAEWDHLFEVYKKIFSENIGIMAGIYESDEIEIDLMVGEESDDVRGMKVFQAVPAAEDDEEEEADEEIDALETDEEDDTEDDSEIVEIMEYDFLAKPDATEADLKGKPYLELTYGKPKDEEEEEKAQDSTEEKSEEEIEDETWFKLILYAQKNPKDAEAPPELTGGLMINGEDPTDKTIFLEHPDLM